MGIAELLTLAGQYGFFNTLTAAIVVTGLLVWRTRTNTQSHVQKTEADSIGVLAKALTELAAGLKTGNDTAARERYENLLTIKEAVGKIQGMMEVLSDNTKATKATSTHIHELSDHIPQIKTDLHDLTTQAQGFSGVLDAKFKTINELLVTFGVQLTTVVQQGKTIINLLTTEDKGQPSHEDPLEAQTD